MADSTIRSCIAEGLLEIGAVSISPHQPYTWASGLKSPIYCDNRKTLGFPILREMIAKSFEEIISYQQLELDVVAGTATAGIPHAAILATHLEKPMCYVRASAKSHGRNNIIEGPSVEGRNVILIEDLISTGMSSLKAVEAIQEAGGTVNAVLAIFSYGFPFADSAFQDAGIPFFVLTNYETLLEAAVAAGSIREDELELLRSWRTNPQKWGDMIRER